MNHRISSTKIIALIFFSILILALLQPLSTAIGLANPATQPSKFALALTATSTPTPTPNPFEITRWQPPKAEPLPITTPDAPVDQYTLTDWNAKTAQLALANPGIHEDVDIDQPNAYLTLLEESYLQFPSLTEDETYLMELAIARDQYSIFSIYPPTFDVLSSMPIYSKLLEDSLNHGNLQPENVEEWINGNIAVSNIDSIQTSNLFGDEKPVWVYNIIKFEGYWQATLFVTRNKDGTFTVSTFSDDEWENKQPKNCDLRIQDLNGNGVPEIMCERVNWYKFGKNNVNKDIAIYEWDGQQYTALQYNPPSVHSFSTDYEENQQDGTTVIIGKQTSKTAENCPAYIEYYNYIWTGHSFEFDHIDVEPLPENTSSACKIRWALTATQNRAESIQAVSVALDDWTGSLNNKSNPALQDYFRLWLAETYALHGESETALQMLDDLITNPQNPLYTGISEMAEVYKNSYIKGSPYLACKTLEEWKENELHNAFELSRSSDLDIQKILSEQWGVSVGTFQSGKSCELYANFPTLLEHQAFSSRNQLVSWLYQNRIQWNGLRETDMNQDGLKDWLVITQTDNARNQLWALIQTEGATQPILVAYTPGGTTVNLQTSCNQYFPEDGSVPVQIYRMGSRVVAFQIIDHGNRSYPFIHFETGDPLDPLRKSFWVRGVELDNKTTTLFFDDYESQYQWHDQHQRFEFLQSNKDDSKFPNLEELLFVEQNPKVVIEELKTWFTTIDTNNDQLMRSFFGEYTLPYRTYLLGLAYELNGDEQNAVQAYWNLWNDYPESPFTIIARYKLSEME